MLYQLNNDTEENDKNRFPGKYLDIVVKLQEQPKVQQLIEKLEACLDDIEFLVDDASLNRALRSLDGPSNEDRILAQLETVVRNEMMAMAADGLPVGEGPNPISEEDIATEAYRRYQEYHFNI